MADVQYRRSPSASFEQQLSDCHAALLYLYSQSADLDIDPDGITMGGRGDGDAGCTTSIAYARALLNAGISVEFHSLPAAVGSPAGADATDARREVEILRALQDNFAFR